MVSNDTANPIAGALQKKLVICEEFLSATLLLRTALETEEMNAVEGLIEKREALIADIGALDRLIGLHRKSHKNDDSSAIHAPLVILGNVRQILDRTALANKDCEGLAANRRDALGKDLQYVQHSAEGIQGYSPKIKRIPLFLSMHT